MRSLRVGLAVLSVPLLLPRVSSAQGGPVGPEFRVNTYTTNQQVGTSVAGDGSGNFVVVWTGGILPTSDAEIFGQRYAASGSPLGPEFRVNTYTTGLQRTATVAASPSGDFVVVWQSAGPPLQDDVFGQRYASSGSPVGPQFQVNTYTTGYQSRAAVAADGSGGFVVVWQGQDGSSYGVFGQRYAASGVPLGPEFRINTFTTGLQGSPSVSADAAGALVVVWHSDGQDGDSYGTFGQRYASSGAPLGGEFRVNTYTTASQRAPSAALADTGTFVVVWSSQQDGSSTGVYAQRYDASGAPAGSEFRVNSYTTNDQFGTDVAADSSGNFVVVWVSNYQQGPPGSGAGSEVFGQRYETTGSSLGSEFRVNTFTPGFQDAPSVATTAGNFVVVWNGRQAPFAEDVFGQRYSQIVPVELLRFVVD